MLGPNALGGLSILPYSHAQAIHVGADPEVVVISHAPGRTHLKALPRDVLDAEGWPSITLYNDLWEEGATWPWQRVELVIEVVPTSDQPPRPDVSTAPAQAP
jgi:hypothetical protein